MSIVTRFVSSTARPRLDLSGCVLYAPLWRPDLGGGTFTSIGDGGIPTHLCTVTGATWTPQGRTLDGVDDDIDAGYGGSAATINQIPCTGFVWVKPTAAGDQIDYDASIMSSDVAGQYGQSIGFDANRKFVMEFHDGWLLTDGAYALDQFYLVCCVWESNSQKIYVNGQLVKSASNASTVTGGANGLIMGRFTPVGADRFTGIIGEDGVVSRALTAQEILQIYLVTKFRYV